MTNKKKVILPSVILVALGILGSLYFAFGHYPPNVISSKLIDGDDRSKGWEEDLSFVETELAQNHKNLFFKLSKDKYEERLADLKENIPVMEDRQIIYELAKLINDAGDSHTQVRLNENKVFPLKFFIFPDGVYLTDSTPEYAGYIGMRLKSINNIPLEKIADRLAPITPHDNDMVFLNTMGAYYSLPQYLTLAGVFDSSDFSASLDSEAINRAVFTFEDGTGLTADLSVVAAEEAEQSYSQTAEGEKRLPLFMQKNDLPYWYTYLEEEKAVYVKYNMCHEDEAYSMEQFSKDVFQCYAEQQGQYLIIDLRDNGGGNSEVFRPFFDQLKKRPDIDREDNLFVIIGRKTFSSAVLNGMEFRNRTNGTLVGEPSGGQPNHYGEVKYLYLANAHLNISYSVKYFRNTKEDVDAIYPDIMVKPSHEDFFKGEDSFLKAALGKG